MFANCVVGMAISQFIILFVSSNMDNWLTLNGRICLLWSQIISIFVQLTLIFSISSLFLKAQKWKKMKKIMHPERGVFQRAYFIQIASSLVFGIAYLCQLILPRAVVVMYYAD